MSLVDVFNADLFSMISLTNAIKKLPYQPKRIQQLGLFTPKGIPTNTAVIEEKAGVLELIMSAKRGAPASLGKESKRTARSFNLIHLPLDDTVLAESISGVREFGSENTLQGVAGVVNDRLTTMKANHITTLEYLSMGAIHGSILEADGVTELFDLFTLFGVSEISVDFVLGTAGTNVRAKCLEVIRAIEVALGAGTFNHIHAFCGKTWFENFTDHATVKTAYERWRDGEALRTDLRRGFEFAGIIFEEYRGIVSGVDFINASQVRFFPVGVPDLFMHYYGPADFMETVNTIGLPLYAKQEVMEMNRGVKLHTQSNVLPICTRPRVLVKGTTSN